MKHGNVSCIGKESLEKGGRRERGGVGRRTYFPFHRKGEGFYISRTPTPKLKGEEANVPSTLSRNTVKENLGSGHGSRDRIIWEKGPEATLFTVSGSLDRKSRTTSCFTRPAPPDQGVFLT